MERARDPFFPLNFKGMGESTLLALGLLRVGKKRVEGLGKEAPPTDGRLNVVFTITQLTTDRFENCIGTTTSPPSGRCVYFFNLTVTSGRNSSFSSI